MLKRITVDPTGWLIAGDQRLRCALGQNGISTEKREGDKASPVGTFHMLHVFYRADRIAPPPQTALALTPLQPDFGWCDDPTHPDYNRLITLPHPANHEKMWRDDGLYDVVVQLDHNTDPVRPGHGSAIFMHVAKLNYDGTEGCIALKLNDLLELLRISNSSTEIVIPRL